MLFRRLILSLFAVTALAGCQPPAEITRHKVERVNFMQRFLGAIIRIPKAGEPGEFEKIWFVKLVGPETRIEPLREPFEAFMQSFEFESPEKLKWKLPEGWVEDEGNEHRYKTIWTGPKDAEPKPLELTITVLPGEASSIRENMNRWRGQMGYTAPLGDFDLEDLYRKMKVGGHEAYLVDMLGPGQGPTAAKKGGPMAGLKGGPPMVAGDKPKSAPPKKLPEAGPAPIKYDLPRGWKEVPATDFITMLKFVVSDKSGSADMTVTALAGDAGGLRANIDRWKKQIGLPGVTAAELSGLKKMEVAGAEATLVDLHNPKGEPSRNRIVGAILPRGGQTFFFKMTGPGDLVGAQKSPFESFLKSVSFER